MTNPLVELQRLGQSPWHDNIRRELLTSGALARMVGDGDITGLTSNPTIFDQAIESGHDYDAQLRELATQGKTPEAIFDALSTTDIRDAADVFAPVHRRTNGGDGFVSIEVDPRYANDTAKTIAEAHRLWDTVRKPNLMVKIPGTAAGLPAIEECIADGLSINVTLIFSLDRYDAVMDAYLAGLERRVKAGKPVDRIASVASFFVSRVDGEVDKRLDALLATAPPDQAEQLKQLKGRAAIANAKLAYVRFREKFGTPRFAELARAGARLQRPLWASTSTKNPAYPDVYYVEALIGPDTVDTMPPATIVAYKDHGRPEVRITRDLDEAAAVLQRLADAGIVMDEVTAKLEVDGVAAFAKSFESLIGTVTAAARQAAGNGGAMKASAVPARRQAAKRARPAPRTPAAPKRRAPAKAKASATKRAKAKPRTARATKPARQARPAAKRRTRSTAAAKTTRKRPARSTGAAKTTRERRARTATSARGAKARLRPTAARRVKPVRGRAKPRVSAGGRGRATTKKPRARATARRRRPAR